MSDTQPTKAEVRKAMEIIDELDLPDGASWQLVHEFLQLEFGDVFAIIAQDPDYFGTTAAEAK